MSNSSPLAYVAPTLNDPVLLNGSLLAATTVLTESFWFTADLTKASTDQAL
jgi:hypothetical protein